MQRSNLLLSDLSVDYRLPASRNLLDIDQKSASVLFGILRRTDEKINVYFPKQWHQKSEAGRGKFFHSRWREKSFFIFSCFPIKNGG